MTISLNISTIATELKSRGVVHPSSQYRENLGKMLSSLMSLIVTVSWMTAISILNLLSLIATILMMLIELLQHIVKKVWNVLCILCRWAVAVKNTILTSKKSQKSAWKGDGVLPQDYTSHYSEMHGEPKYKNAQHEKAMKAPINEDKIRRAGW